MIVFTFINERTRFLLSYEQQVLFEKEFCLSLPASCTSIAQHWMHSHTGLGESLGVYLALTELPPPGALRHAAAQLQQARAVPDQLLQKLLQSHGPDALLLPLAAALPGTPVTALQVAAACILA